MTGTRDTCIASLASLLLGGLQAHVYCLGYRRTSSKSRYFKRMVLIAVVSEIPYMLAMQAIKVNIVGTFLVCFIALLTIERIKNKIRWLLLILY